MGEMHVFAPNEIVHVAVHEERLAVEERTSIPADGALILLHSDASLCRVVYLDEGRYALVRFVGSRVLTAVPGTVHSRAHPCPEHSLVKEVDEPVLPPTKT